MKTAGVGLWPAAVLDGLRGDGRVEFTDGRGLDLGPYFPRLSGPNGGEVVRPLNLRDLGIADPVNRVPSVGW